MSCSSNSWLRLRLSNTDSLVYEHTHSIWSCVTRVSTWFCVCVCVSMVALLHCLQYEKIIVMLRTLLQETHISFIITRAVWVATFHYIYIYIYSHIKSPGIVTWQVSPTGELFRVVPCVCACAQSICLVRIQHSTTHGDKNTSSNTRNISSVVGQDVDAPHAWPHLLWPVATT